MCGLIERSLLHCPCAIDMLLRWDCIRLQRRIRIRKCLHNAEDSAKTTPQPRRGLQGRRPRAQTWTLHRFPCTF